MRLLDVIPLSSNGGGISIDDDDLIRRKVNEFGNTLGIKRDWSWTDPLREGTAGVVHNTFDTSNMENERLQSLIGLDDNQFIEAVRSGRVRRDEWPLGKMPQRERDTLLQSELDKRNRWQQGVNDVADYIMPEPHAQPEGYLETGAYEFLKAIPGAVEAVGEFALARNIPFGQAALFFKNVLSGSQNAQEQVYSNVRNQGKSPDEARQAAMSPLGNIADLGIRGVTQAATLNALGQIPTINGATSPIMQTIGNIAKGSAYSGVGAMGESALTDVRSGNDIDTGTMAKRGAIAAGATGLLGTLNAASQGRKLWDLQKQYYANRPIDIEAREIFSEPKRLGAGDIPDNTGTPEPNIPPAPEPSQDELLSTVDRYNNAVTKRGFEPVTGSHTIEQSFSEIQNAIQYGQITPDDVHIMMNEAGLAPNVAQGMVDNGIQARKNDLRNMYGMRVHDGMSKPEVDVISPLKPQNTWVDPLKLGYGNKPDNPFRADVDVLGGVPSPEVTVNEVNIPKPQAPDTHSMSLDDPLLAPTDRPETEQSLLDALNGEDTLSQSPVVSEPVQPTSPEVPQQTQNHTPLMALEPQQTTTQSSIMPYVQPDSDIVPYPAPAPFDPHGAPYETPIHTANTELQPPSILGSIPSINKPDVLGGMSTPDVQVNGGISPMQTPTIHSWTPPKKPRVHTLDLNDPRLAPPDYGKNTPENPTAEPQETDDDNDEGFIGELDINHMGRSRKVYVYADEAEGRPYIDIADANGDSVAVYIPDEDAFMLREEVQRQGWARNIEGELRRQLPALLKKAGLSTNAPAPNLTSIQALDNKKPEPQPTPEQNPEQQPTPNHTPILALEPEKQPEVQPQKTDSNKKNTGKKTPEQIAENYLDDDEVYSALLAGYGLTPEDINNQKPENQADNPSDTQTPNHTPLIALEPEKKPEQQKGNLIPKGAKLRNGTVSIDENAEYDGYKPSGSDRNFHVVANSSKGTLTFYNSFAKGQPPFAQYDANNDTFSLLDKSASYYPQLAKLLEQAFRGNIRNFYSDNSNNTQTQTPEQIDTLTTHKPEPDNTNDSLINNKAAFEFKVDSDTYRVVPDDTSIPEEHRKYHVYLKLEKNQVYYITNKGRVSNQSGWEDTGFVFQNGKMYLSDSSGNLYLLSYVGPTENKIAQAIRQHLESTKEHDLHEQPKVKTPKQPKHEPGKDTASSKPEPKPEAKADSNPYVTVANDVKNFLEEVIIKKSAEAKPMSNQELFRLADKAFGGTQGQGKYTPKDAYDAMEMGVNMFIRNTRVNPSKAESADDVYSVIQRLNHILSLLPTQRNRTEEQNEFQQFSTPPTLAYLVNWIANIQQGDVVLEPSAGVGGLAVFAKNAGATLVLNELAPRRANLLEAMKLGQVYRENAEHIGNILAPKNISVDRVIMNPPFSATAGRIKGQRDTRNAIKHVEQALQLLKPNGRLVAILGKGMTDDAPAFRDWWKHIKKKYNVRAIIQVDGRNYAKYGTTFDNIIAIIDNNGPTPTRGNKRTYSPGFDFQLLEDIVHHLIDIRNDLPTKSNEDAGQKLETETSPAPAQDNKPQADKKPEPTPEKQEATETKPADKPEVSPQTQEGQTKPKPERKPKPATEAKPKPEKKPEPTEPKNSIADIEATPTSGINISVKSKKEIEAENKADNKSSTTSKPKDTDDVDAPDAEELSINSRYHSQFTGFAEHPGILDESTAMRSVEMPAASYVPKLPAYIQEDGLLSNAQIVPVVYAGQSFRHKNPDGSRRGYFIGDGTGVGKGREIAAIIMDALAHGYGKGKAVWISDKHSLIKDAKRDWEGLRNNPDDVFAQEGITDKKLAKRDKGIIFTAYSYMKKARIEQLKNWLGQDFDGIIVLDECHNVNNVLSEKKASGFGYTKPATSALNTRDFVRAFPNARVLYVSATGATDIRNAAMFERLGLWGHSALSGDGFASADDFVSSVAKGGTAGLELYARDLKAMGLFNARTLSMEGVTFRTLEHSLTPHQIAIYDTLAECWQIILKNIENAIAICGGEAKNGIGSAIAKFWNSHQNFFNQIIITLQTPAMIQDIDRQLKAGNSIVIQLTNTFAANQEAALNKLKQSAKEGDELSYEDLDISPKEIMFKFLNECFPIYQMETYTDDEGNERTRPVLDSQGKPVINQIALRMRDELIAKVNSIKQFPESPLDLILDHFGADNVAEVTGRSRRFIFDQNGKRVEEKRNNSKIQGEINDFNEGRKRILIFSEKGGTGASYHASNDYPNKQKRIHYLLQAGWRADKAMQGLGRTHRSNEANQPEYVLVTTDVPGQKRFLSTIARRLEQLGALTTGERKSTTQGLFSEDDNLEANYVQDAVKQLFINLMEGAYPELDNPDDILSQLGFTPETFSASSKNVPDVTRFLNRILSMKVAEQKKLFARFSELIAKNKEVAKTLNKLDMRTSNIRADKINILQESTITRNREYGTETKYVELELVRKLIPRTWDNVMRRKPTAFYMIDTGEIVAAVPRERSKTDVESGITSQAFTLYYVNPRKGTTDTSEHILNNQSPRQLRHFTKLNMADAERIWNEQIKQLPPTYSEKKHMITGVLLPIWKQLGTSNLRVQRVTTDDGRSFLGRIIPENDLRATLAKLNIYYDSDKKYSPEQLLSELDKQGMVATLSNNIKLKFSRVNGEKRLEILNFDFFQEATLVRDGCIKEYINSKPRLFIPSGNKAMLEKLLKASPVVRVAQSRFANDIMEETTDDVNSEIPDSNKLYAFHPFFRPDPEDNPYIESSPYAFDNEETEKRYQSSKKVKKERLLDRIAKFAHDAAKGWVSDFPELAGHKNLIYAQELLRKLNRERKADVQETVKRMRAVTHKLNDDDFDLFSRAMQLLDLKETLETDENAALPWGFTPEILANEYNKIMKEVDHNPNVADAIEKAEILGRELTDDLINAAEELHLYSLRDRLKREHYFRHVVLDYFNQATGGAGATLRNPTRRGYLKHRKGSDKDISSDWITAMGEVWARMNGDIKILHTLAKLRKEYDIVEDLKQQAFNRNKDQALYQLMDTLKDSYSNADDLRVAANSALNSILNKKLSQSVGRLFKMAQRGELPEGDNQQWHELVYAMNLSGTLEQLPPKYRNDFTRYVGWLAGLEDDSRAKATAQRFLRSGLHKDRNLKKMLGDKFTTWQDLIPDDYDIWTPFDSKLVFSVSSVPENVMKIAEQNIDELLGMPLSEIGNALSMGGDKQIWVIPSALAKTLNDMGKRTPPGLLAKAARKAMSYFKSWVLFTPVNGRVFKYNWRNFFGDLEAVLQGNPEAIMYIKQAFNELKNIYIYGGEARGMLAQFQKRGGALTAESREELLHNWEDLEDFANLLSEKKHVSPLKMTLGMFKGYMKMAGKLTEFREAILRYAAFLAYVHMLQENNGNPAFYGMSKPDEVNALKDDIYDMAFKMANETLGAYDQISQNTKWLRDNSWLSFISWVEVNFRRSIQMYKNIWSGNSFLEYWLRRHGGDFINRFFDGGGGNGNKPPRGNNGSDWDEDDNNNFRKLFRKLGKSPVYAMRFAITLALAAPLMLILSVFNWLNSENDDKLTPEVKARPHLTLNTNERTGEVLYFSRIGSAFDFFETIGVDTLPRDLKELFDGRITFTELANRITDGPISKLVSNFNPFFKAAVELLTGRKLYPDIEHPTSIRDNWEYVAQSLGLDWYYKMLTGKPHEPAWNLSSSIANTQKPDEAAYWYILSRKKEFQEQILGRVYDGYTQTKQGEALYNARMAAHYGDKKMMRQYLKEFYRAGGVDKGLEASVRAMNPMYGLNDDEELRFLKWLPREERKTLRKALRFYERMKATLSI